MVRGLGNDIIEIARIKGAIARHGAHFLDKIFTSKEQEYCLRHKDAATHFAGRFAAKEAVSKALGKGMGEVISWLDIEVQNNAEGKPYVVLSDKAKALFKTPEIHIAISHCREYAVATALY